MKATRQELVSVELQRAEEAFAVARLALEGHFWNSAASELYYAYFYLIQALFAATNMQAHTHSGVKSIFSLRFIKENLIDEKWGKLLSRLFEFRQKGNYGDYKVTGEEILPLEDNVKAFKIIVLELIEQAGYKTNNES